VEAEMGLREEQDTRDGAVRKHEELLSDDAGTALFCRGEESPLELVAIGQDCGTANPRIHGVEAHLAYVLVSGPELVAPDGEVVEHRLLRFSGGRDGAAWAIELCAVLAGLAGGEDQATPGKGATQTVIETLLLPGR
jgi:hypothetical protein